MLLRSPLMMSTAKSGCLERDCDLLEALFLLCLLLCILCLWARVGAVSPPAGCVATLTYELEIALNATNPIMVAPTTAALAMITMPAGLLMKLDALESLSGLVINTFSLLPVLLLLLLLLL